jgi:hypothetical protein
MAAHDHLFIAVIAGVIILAVVAFVGWCLWARRRTRTQLTPAPTIQIPLYAPASPAPPALFPPVAPVLTISTASPIPQPSSILANRIFPLRPIA